MNEDFPWFLLAMVIIAFLRWIVLKIQGKSATDAFDETLFAEDEKEGKEGKDGKRSRPPRMPADTRADPTLDPNEEIRRFFEALGGGTRTETAAPPPQAPPPRKAERAAPPPIPAKPKKPLPAEFAVERRRRAELSAEEQAALMRIRERGAAPSPRKRAHAAAGGTVSFRDLVAGPESLKTAVILKEILDEPRGLRSFDESRSF